MVAAAVILDPLNPIPGLNDSKKLSAKRRDALAVEIRAKALAWSVAEASVEEIDRINILQASLLAMRRAVEGLKIQPETALMNGNVVLVACPAGGVVGGDGKVASIARRPSGRQFATPARWFCMPSTRCTVSIGTWAILPLHLGLARTRASSGASSNYLDL